jgi:hypothetical protein
VRRSPPEPGVPVVLWPRPEWRSTRLLDLLEEPARPLSRKRSPAPPFETVLPRCTVKGLVDGEGFAVDASLIHADAGDRNRVEGSTGLPPNGPGRAVAQYLAMLDDAAVGAATEVTQVFIAAADPATRLTRGASRAGFSPIRHLIDVDKFLQL